MSATTCPKCGYDMTALHALAIGDLTIQHDGAVILWKGKLVALSRCERLLVVCLARADGAAVDRAALAEAGGYEGDAVSNWISVMLNRLNHKFRYLDKAFDCIENVRGTGVRWRA